MQWSFNITHNNKKYGVLVRPKKYGFSYKIAKSPFKKESPSYLRDELLQALKIPKLRDKFFSGKTIEL